MAEPVRIAPLPLVATAFTGLILVVGTFGIACQGSSEGILRIVLALRL
jgi:hypothetical protein